MVESTRYEEAHRQVRRLSGLYQHAAVYVAINVFLLVINLMTSPQVWWCVWPALGWGAGLAAHAAAIYGRRYTREWEERKIRALLADEGR